MFYAYQGIHLIATYKIPFIALISEMTFDGASAFAMSSKYRIATEKTIFATAEATFGYFNDCGASFYLPRLDKNFGIYLGMTGEKVFGFDVKKTGIASHFVELKNLRDLENALSNCEGCDDVENVLDEFSFIPKSSGSKLDENLERINKSFSGLTVEQVIEYLNLDGSEWAQKALKILNKNSPTSVKVCHHLLNLGRYMSLEDCCRMEYRMISNFNESIDFREGRRANKDMEPKWNPATIKEVTDKQLSRFFDPLAEKDELQFENDRNSQDYD